MSENTEFVPELTLNPDGFPSFEEALAATEAPAAAAAAAAPTLEEDNAVIKESIDSQMSSLTEEERKQVEAFSKQIDITDTNTVLTYGAASQKHISDFVQQQRRCRHFERTVEKSIIRTLNRFDEILRKRVNQASQLGMSAKFMEAIMSVIHEESVRQQVDILSRSKDIEQQ